MSDPNYPLGFVPAQSLPEGQAVPPPAPVKKKKKKEEEPPARLLRFGPGVPKMEKLKALYNEWYGCTRCPLSTFRVGDNGAPFPDITFAEGNPDARIMIVGEAPGAEEEACSVPFVGASGRLLNQILASISADSGIRELFEWYQSTKRVGDDQKWFHEKMLEWRHKEYFITNVVACRPPDNRQPNNAEAKACWERLYNIIYIVDPWLIIASGKTAANILCHRQIEVTKLRGQIFDADVPGLVTTFKKPVMPTFHPSYLLRVADWRSKNGDYMNTVRDFLMAHRWIDKKASLLLGEPLPERPDLSR